MLANWLNAIIFLVIRIDHSMSEYFFVECPHLMIGEGRSWKCQILIAQGSPEGEVQA
jgi:hypothetical protein